jgi:hypothetical protein
MSKDVSMNALALCALLVAMPVVAQKQQAMNPPAPPPLSAEAAAAYEELAPRFAQESQLIPGWFRDRTVLYYDFGAVPLDVAAGTVYWPVHGFDMRGNPVAIRGQRPIFSTIPGLNDYSGIFRLVYVVTADNAQPNFIRDLATMEEQIRRKRASTRPTDLLLNLPIVPRGARLARDSSTGMAGWYEGRDVQFFDFGAVTVKPVEMWRFASGRDASGAPIVLDTQNSIVDSIPVAGTYPDLWEIRFVYVDSAFAPNSLKSADAIRSNMRVRIDTARTIRNLPITIIDGLKITRAPSPFRAFSDLRSPFPPKPTLAMPLAPATTPTPPAN